MTEYKKVIFEVLNLTNRYIKTLNNEKQVIVFVESTSKVITYSVPRGKLIGYTL